MGRISDVFEKIQGNEPFIEWGELFWRFGFKRPFSRASSSISRFWLERNTRVEPDGEFEKIIFPDGTIIFWPSEFTKRSVFSVWEELHSSGPDNYFNFYRPDPADVVFDVGASEGLFSALIKKEVSRVFLFEPIKKLVSALQKTFYTEIEQDRFFIFPVALGEKGYKAAMQINMGGIGSSRVCSDNEMERPESDQFDNSCDVVSLDRYLDNFLLDRIDLIKMDIEGFERFALKGARETIKRFRPDLLICSYHLPDDYESISGFLCEIGYTVSTSKPIKIEPGGRPFFRPALIYGKPR